MDKTVEEREQGNGVIIGGKCGVKREQRLSGILKL